MVNTTRRPLSSRKRPGTHCTGGWVGPRADLEGRGKSRPTPGFDPRTVQPVANRYTDWAIPALNTPNFVPITIILSSLPLFPQSHLSRPTHCSCSVTTTPDHTKFTYTQPEGLLWTRDRPFAETCTWHITLTRNRHPCSHQQDSNPPSQKVIGRRPTSYAARPTGSAVKYSTLQKIRFVPHREQWHDYTDQLDDAVWVA